MRAFSKPRSLLTYVIHKEINFFVCFLAALCGSFPPVRRAYLTYLDLCWPIVRRRSACLFVCRALREFSIFHMRPPRCRLDCPQAVTLPYVVARTRKSACANHWIFRNGPHPPTGWLTTELPFSLPLRCPALVLRSLKGTASPFRAGSLSRCCVPRPSNYREMGGTFVLFSFAFLAVHDLGGGGGVL